MAVRRPSCSVLRGRFAVYQTGRNPFSTRSRLQDPKQCPRHVDVEELLSKPNWSISSLLPPSDTSRNSTSPSISSQQLHHLIRLSALPPPSSLEEESRLLSTLSSQLHFVQEIQKVVTTGIEPLASLRDETEEGEEKSEIGMEQLRDALGEEEVVGKWYRRVRRKKVASGEEGSGDGEGKWDVLDTAGRKVGRYLVVEGGPKG